MSRSEESQEKLCVAGWDLVVFDEAHKLSAHFYGSKIEKTGRFKLAEKIGQHTRHLLLMTAIQPYVPPYIPPYERYPQSNGPYWTQPNS